MWLFSLFTATNCRLQRLHCWGLMSKCCHLKERLDKRQKCFVHLCRTSEFLCLKNVPHSSHFHFLSVLCTFMCTCRVLDWLTKTSSVQPWYRWLPRSSEGTPTPSRLQQQIEVKARNLPEGRWTSKLHYKEGSTHYAGRLIDPAKGFGRRPSPFFCLSSFFCRFWE